MFQAFQSFVPPPPFPEAKLRIRKCGNIDSDAEPLPNPHLKGSKDRFLERAETREDGENPYLRPLLGHKPSVQPPTGANGQGVYGGNTGEMQAHPCFELYFLLVPPPSL